MRSVHVLPRRCALCNRPRLGALPVQFAKCRMVKAFELSHDSGTDGLFRKVLNSKLLKAVDSDWELFKFPTVTLVGLRYQ